MGSPPRDLHRWECLDCGFRFWVEYYGRFTTFKPKECPSCSAKEHRLFHGQLERKGCGNVCHQSKENEELLALWLAMRDKGGIDMSICTTCDGTKRIRHFDRPSTNLYPCPRCNGTGEEPAPREDADYCQTVHLTQGEIHSSWFPPEQETRPFCSTWCLTHERWIGACAYHWFLLAKALDPTAHRDTLLARVAATRATEKSED